MSNDFAFRPTIGSPESPPITDHRMLLAADSGLPLATATTRNAPCRPPLFPSSEHQTMRPPERASLAAPGLRVPSGCMVTTTLSVNVSLVSDNRVPFRGGAPVFRRCAKRLGVGSRFGSETDITPSHAQPRARRGALRFWRWRERLACDRSTRAPPEPPPRPRWSGVPSPRSRPS